MLMQPETLAEETSGAAAFHRPANFFDGHYAKFGAAPFRQAVPVGDQATQNQPLAGLPYPREIAALRQPRLTGQGEGFRVGVYKIKPESGACGPGGGGWPKWPCRFW